MATKLIVEVPPGQPVHNQLVYIKTKDDAIPYRGVPVPTFSDAEQGAPLGICVGSKHVLGSLWDLTIVVEGVVTFYAPEDVEIGALYENGLLNLGGNRVYVAQERIAPLPCLR